LELQNFVTLIDSIVAASKEHSTAPLDMSRQIIKQVSSYVVQSLSMHTSPDLVNTHD